jgi:phenylalanine-4-hydroxylase
MRLRKDFENLVRRFQKESMSNKVDMMNVFKDSLVFFESIKEALREANHEEKKEIMKLMGEMHEFLRLEAKKIAARAGLTEEQMQNFAQNPDNFNPVQWKALENIKDKLAVSAQEVKEIINPEAAAKEKKLNRPTP